MLLPLHAQVSPGQAALARTGFAAGDLLRAFARTPAGVLPRSRRLNAVHTRALAPGLEATGLRGGLLSFDGQLVDDARLVVALARTAAWHGARVVTRCSAQELRGDGATLRDELTGQTLEVPARAVVNACGVWAGKLASQVRLRPSRGTHLVVPASALDHPHAALTVPVPGSVNRFVLALPQMGGRVYIGLTDEPVDGIPDVPRAPESDITFLLETVNRALHRPLTRDDVIGTFAGLRPLLDTGERGRTADVSRRHAVLVSDDGVVTAVGGKLTTYRAMAEDAVDAAVRTAGLPAGPCRTTRLPLVGAASRRTLDEVSGPDSLVARYGTEAPRVLALAEGRPDLLGPVAAGVTGAELLFAVRHEGALDADDILDRRTRIGLVPADREEALPFVESLCAGV
ncbi:glycerol-3-phosphate dehydrogenase [Wenjunlia tyrosinilytica]|uniref:Glycerol-3-phosphate dehydrogenase n=2 Tax=Wenjunlia tyrosinilytica TaxID=1544741 RepID=A0A917ZRS1_9ACTN|nr:glycerol-3-phosphate dehydrogenase [Wenjunlia tyrosinilytica]